MLDIEAHGYLKSSKTLNDGTPIYFPDNLTYWKNIYETFISEKTGERREVVVRRDPIKYIFSNEDIRIEREYCSHNIFDLDIFDFQFNLNRYCCFRKSYLSAYEEVYRFTGTQFNKAPEYCFVRGIRDMCEISGYYLFWERCFSSGNAHTIYNYIPDRMFFNYKDRKHAVERIFAMYSDGNYYHNPTFDNIDYINMDDNDLVSFMNDRFKKRLLFEKLLHKRPVYLFT